MRQDNYPTRLNDSDSFIERIEPTVYYKPSTFTKTQIEFYEENGFLKVPGFFDLNKIKETLHEAAYLYKSPTYGHITREPKIKTIRSITGIHEKDLFRALASEVSGIASSILGSKVYIHQSRINYKGEIGSNGWYWHSDFETWHAQDGMTSMRCLSAMIPLTENNYTNAPLMVIPRSHKLFYGSKKGKEFSAEENFADQKEGVPTLEAMSRFFDLSNNKVEIITCEPGDLVLFDCNIIHGSTENMTPFARTNLFFVYNSVENKLTAPYSAKNERPEEMGARQNTKEI